MNPELQRIYANIDENIERHIARLQEAVRQKSISHTGEGIEECAKLWVSYMKDVIGCQEASVVPVGKSKWGLEGDPVAYGKYDAGAEKTLLIYNMYDVMPVQEWTLPDAPVPKELKWRVDPWAGELVEEPPFPKVLMARGATNSKGPQVAFFNACESIKEIAGELPVNLIFVAEGDEERMDIGLHTFVHKYKDELNKADAVYLQMGRTNRNGVASVNSGSEGCIFFELETSGASWGRGPSVPVHGANKRWLDSPAWRHIDMLSTLTKANGNEILIQGWYDGIEEPSEDDMSILKEMAEKTNIDQAKKALGASVFIGDETDPVKLLKMRTFSTSFNLDGIWGGRILDTGAGSILPEKVTSKHNCRYIPDQNGDDLHMKLRAHLDKHGYGDVRIRIVGDVDWHRSDLNTDIGRAVLKMFDQFNVEVMPPMPPTVPGSWPPSAPYWPAALFGKQPLQLPIAGGALGYGDRAHSINEFYVIEGSGKVHGLSGAEKSMATVLYNYAGKN
jgi:acetylornithine deacetylase/succinyl-diaminopimelate desuccinylase-like protein